MGGLSMAYRLTLSARAFGGGGFAITAMLVFGHAGLPAR